MPPVRPHPLHPEVELRANPESNSYRCHLFEVASVWELTKETIYLSLGCLQGGTSVENGEQGALRSEVVSSHLLEFRAAMPYRGP